MSMRDAFRGSRGANDVERRFDHGAQIHRLGAQLQLARDHARQLDEIFDDTRLRLRVALDAGHGALERLRDPCRSCG